jgi:hypothetical protein
MHSVVESDEIIAFRILWSSLFKVSAPADEQFALWLFRHGANVMNAAIAELATKYQKLGGNMDENYMIRFASSVANRMSREN